MYFYTFLSDPGVNFKDILDWLSIMQRSTVYNSQYAINYMEILGGVINFRI